MGSSDQLSCTNFRSVKLHDVANVSIGNLSSHFYLTEADVGRNRADASCPKLAELNGYVSVTSCTDRLDRDLIRGHSVVVLANAPLSEQLRIAALTRFGKYYDWLQRSGGSLSPRKFWTSKVCTTFSRSRFKILFKQCFKNRQKNIS